jgi:hypothetical protein
MREIIGHSRNMALMEADDGKLLTTVEVVLLLSETKYQSDISGFVKVREIKDVRFATGVKQLRNLAKEFGEMADDAEHLQERATLLPDDSGA